MYFKIQFSQISDQKRVKNALTLGVSILSLFVASSALAQSITVRNGETLNAGVETNNPGETITVETGGTINASTESATTSNSADGKVVIDGTVTTTGAGNRGLFSTGDRTTVEIGGTVSTTGANSHGIDIASGDSVIVTNNAGGVITTTGAGAMGISTSGTKNQVINRGQVNVSGAASYAMQIDGDNSSVENAGTLNATASASGGLHVFADSVKASNSGTINATGTTAVGIRYEGANGTITNTGTINAQSTGRRGVSIDGSNNTFINRGSILAGSDDAIEFEGATNDTLTLGVGTLIRGNIKFNGGTDTLNVENGISIHYTFDKKPETINSNGVPVIVQGTTVDVLDTTGLANVDNSIDSLIGDTFDILAARSSLPNSQQVTAHGYAPAEQSEWPEGADWQQPAHQSTVWSEGFAGLQFNNASGSSASSHTGFGGAIVGIDTQANTEWLLGGFVGAGVNRLTTSGSGQTIDSITQLLGLYGQYEDVLDFSLGGGITQHSSSRAVLNNVVDGGLETAKANYNGYFVSPEVTLHAPTFKLSGLNARASVRGQYTFQHIDGYTETDSEAALTVGARNTHALDGRAQIAVDVMEKENTNAVLTAGVDARFGWGANAVTATMLGENLSFDPGGATSSVSAFGALRIDHQMSENTTVYFGSQMSTGTAHAFNINANLGFKSEF